VSIENLRVDGFRLQHTMEELAAATLTSAQTIRVEPPLVIEYEQINKVLNRLQDTLEELSKDTE